MTELDRRGPLAAYEIRRRWPLTRQHLRTALNELEEKGLVERCRSELRSISHRVMLTPAGRRTLEIVSWDEAMRADAAGRRS